MHGFDPEQPTRYTDTGHEPSPRLGDCEGSTAATRGGSPDVGNWH
jgi:hypothetical protein